MTGVFRDSGGDWPKTREHSVACEQCGMPVDDEFLEIGFSHSQRYAAGGIATVSGVHVFHRACGEIVWQRALATAEKQP